MEYQTQQIADKVTLGPHQFEATATDEDGRTGRWVFHRPTINEQIRIAVLKEQMKTPPTKGMDGSPLSAPVELGTIHENVAYMVAAFNVVCDMRPSWFPKDFGECHDTDLLIELWGQFEKWQYSFRRNVPEDGG